MIFRNFKINPHLQKYPKRLEMNGPSDNSKKETTTAYKAKKRLKISDFTLRPLPYMAVGY
jgi:hypothetical protein